MNTEQRYQALLDAVKAHQVIWILNDEYGSVMLRTEDEDCVPVWPSKEEALVWATGEWSQCEALAISVEDWLAKWTTGLEGDDVSIAIHPQIEEAGLVIFPDTFDADIRKRLSF